LLIFLHKPKSDDVVLSIMKTVTEHNLVIALGPLRKDVIELIEENDLPTSDLDEGKTLFAIVQNDKVIGTAGLELFDACVLLRSIGVKKEWRGKGLGKLITRELEKICREKGIMNMYLLTMTAKDFFSRLGYRIIDRCNAPSSIKSSSEFSTVCSSTAILMHKLLS
jgi:amino-acid N-acetyltransferase